MVFDKTGTLTAGKPHVVDIRATHQGLVVPDVLALAAAVEAHSEHPIASAILGLLARQQQLAAATPKAAGGQPANGYSSSGGDSAFGMSGSSGGDGGARGVMAPRLLQVRDVEVTVGQGISGWVQLRGPAAAAALERSGDSGINLAALLAIPAAAAGSHALAAGEHAAAASAGGPAERSFALASLLSSAAGSLASSAGPQPGSAKMAAPAEEVRVVVGNMRQMEAAGVAVPPAAEAYMRDQEGRGSTCVLVAVHQVGWGPAAAAGMVAGGEQTQRPVAGGTAGSCSRVSLHAVLAASVCSHGRAWPTCGCPGPECPRVAPACLLLLLLCADAGGRDCSDGPHQARGQVGARLVCVCRGCLGLCRRRPGPLRWLGQTRAESLAAAGESHQGGSRAWGRVFPCARLPLPTSRSRRNRPPLPCSRSQGRGGGAAPDGHAVRAADW